MEQTSQFAVQAGIFSPPCSVSCNAVLRCCDHVFAFVPDDLERFVEDRSQHWKDWSVTNATSVVMVDLCRRNIQPICCTGCLCARCCVPCNVRGSAIDAASLRYGIAIPLPLRETSMRSSALLERSQQGKKRINAKSRAQFRIALGRVLSLREGEAPAEPSCCRAAESCVSAVLWATPAT
jgi:hypothetical protein